MNEIESYSYANDRVIICGPSFERHSSMSPYFLMLSMYLFLLATVSSNIPSFVVTCFCYSCCWCVLQFCCDDSNLSFQFRKRSSCLQVSGLCGISNGVDSMH